MLTGQRPGGGLRGCQASTAARESQAGEGLSQGWRTRPVPGPAVSLVKHTLSLGSLCEFSRRGCKCVTFLPTVSFWGVGLFAFCQALGLHS